MAHLTHPHGFTGLHTDQSFSFCDSNGIHTYFLSIRWWNLITQSKNIAEILVEINMTQTKPLASSVDCSPPKSKSEAEAHKLNSLCDILMYRHVVERCQYLCITRPDLAFAIGKVSQNMHASTHHSSLGWSEAYSSISCRYHSYGNLYLKRQDCRSPTTSISEVLWLISFLKEIGLPPRPPKLGCGKSWCDSTDDPVFHTRSRHLEIEIQLLVHYISGEDQVANQAVAKS